MSTLQAQTVKSLNSSPPTFKNSSDVEIGTLCRAWVNFNGTGTVAIRASFNVSSITDNGTGDYTVNFTTALSDANYASVCTSGGNSTGLLAAGRQDTTAKTTTAYRMGTFTTAGAGADVADANVAIFR